MDCTPAWAWAVVLTLSWLGGAFFGISEQAARGRGIDPLGNRVVVLCVASVAVPLVVTVFLAVGL